jgi:hypothetical protein
MNRPLGFAASAASQPSHFAPTATRKRTFARCIPERSAVGSGLRQDRPFAQTIAIAQGELAILRGDGSASAVMGSVSDAGDGGGHQRGSGP